MTPLSGAPRRRPASRVLRRVSLWRDPALVAVARDPQLRLSAGCLILFGFFGASLFPYQSLLGIRRYGLSEGLFSALLLGALLFSLGASIGIGIVTDQRPLRRRMALLAAAALPAGAGVAWMLDSAAGFVLAHGLFFPLAGTLFGQVFAAARIAADRHDPARRDGILAAIRASFALPFVAVLPLWGLGFDAGLSLLALYPGIGLAGLANLWLIWRVWPADVPDETPGGPDRADRGGLRAGLAEMLALPVLGRVALIGAIHSGNALGGILLGLSFGLGAGRPDAHVGLFFGAFVAVEIVVTLCVGALLTRVRRLHLIATGTVIYALYLALLPPLAPTAAVWLLILPAGVGGALIYALAISYLQDLLGLRPGAGGALIAVQKLVSDGLGAGFFALGALLTTAPTGGYALSAAMGAGTTLLAIATVLWLDRQRGR